MLDLASFKNALENIKLMRNKERIFCDALEALCPDNYVNCFLYNDYEVYYIDMIKKALNISDDCEVLEWWIYDCEFGNKFAKVELEDKTILTLNTPELIYDYLINISKRGE